MGSSLPLVPNILQFSPADLLYRLGNVSTKVILKCIHKVFVKHASLLEGKAALFSFTDLPTSRWPTLLLHTAVGLNIILILFSNY